MTVSRGQRSIDNLVTIEGKQYVGVFWIVICLGLTEPADWSNIPKVACWWSGLAGWAGRLGSSSYGAVCAMNVMGIPERFRGTIHRNSREEVMVSEYSRLGFSRKV